MRNFWGIPVFCCMNIKKYTMKLDYRCVNMSSFSGFLYPGEGSEVEGEVDQTGTRWEGVAGQVRPDPGAMEWICRQLPSFFFGKVYRMWGPLFDSVQLVNITPISLWFMVFITIVTGANLNQQTYLGGLTLQNSLLVKRNWHMVRANFSRKPVIWFFWFSQESSILESTKVFTLLSII